MLLSVLACAPEQTPPPLEAPASSPPLVRVPVEEQEVLLSVEPPYQLYNQGPVTVADFDRDGFVDILLELLAPEGEDRWKQVVVRGLLSDTQVPSDAWVVLDGFVTYLWAAEVTGDGWMDLVAEHDPDGAIVGAERSTWLLPSPYDGSSEPGPSWGSFPQDWLGGWWVDIDRDGTRDLARDASWSEPGHEALHITWGPSTRWEGPPDVIVEPLCRQGETYGYPVGLDGAVFPGDLDGDGTPELTVPRWGWAYGDEDCGAFTLSLPESGTIDPFSSDGVTDGLYAPSTSIGDWSGDGLPEVWRDGEVLLSPVELTADGLVGSGSLPWGIDVLPARFDLGEDGQLDAVGVAGRLLVVLPVEAATLTAPDLSQGWELGPYDAVHPYLEQGHAFVAIADPVTSTLRRIDLGPAALP